MAGQGPGADMKAAISVDGRLFCATALFCSREPVREALCGVRIEPHPKGGALLCGTDGHRMLVAFDAEATVRRALTVRPDAELVTALRGGARLRVSAGGLVAAGGFDSAGPLIIVEPFPPRWREVVRDALDCQKSPAEHPSFNPRYLQSFYRAARLLEPKIETPAVRVVASGLSSAALVELQSTKALGILMPMRPQWEPRRRLLWLRSALPRKRRRKAA